jgi:hypothetical protein
MGRIWEYIKEEERKAQLKAEIKEEWERRNTCAKCKKIFRGDGYPNKRGFFGSVKNYVCEDCAIELGIIPKRKRH